MTQKIDQLMEAKEGIGVGQIAFDGDDLDDLRARAGDPAHPHCIRAIELLAPVISSDALVPAAVVLAGGDPHLSAAAMAAVVSAGEDAVPFLLGGAVFPDPIVAYAAWHALQQAAHSTALDALAVAQGQTVSEAQGQASFARAVVAYRAGIAGFEISDPDPSLLLELDRGGDARPIEISAVSDGDFALLTELSSSERYLLSAEASATTTLTCAGRDLLVALDAEVRDQVPDTLLQAPMLLALVGLLDPFHNSCSVLYLALTRPDGAGGARMTVHGTGGELVYAGPGTVSDGAVEFTLQSVAMPGAVSIALSATVTTAGLTITEALSAGQVSESTPKLEASPDFDDIPIL